MTLIHILIFAVLGLAAGRFYKSISRARLLFVASVLAVFWLQPASLVRNLPFLFPTISLGLCRPGLDLNFAQRSMQPRKQDRRAAGLLGGLVLLVSLGRVLLIEFSGLLAVRPPQIDLAAGRARRRSRHLRFCWLPARPRPQLAAEWNSPVHYCHLRRAQIPAIGARRQRLLAILGWPGPKLAVSVRFGLAWFLGYRLPPYPRLARPVFRSPAAGNVA